jgi:hypothetical protein
MYCTWETIYTDDRPQTDGHTLNLSYYLMTMSQSKIGEIGKKVYQEEQDGEIYPKMQ